MSESETSRQASSDANGGAPRHRSGGNAVAKGCLVVLLLLALAAFIVSLGWGRIGAGSLFFLFLIVVSVIGLVQLSRGRPGTEAGAEPHPPSRQLETLDRLAERLGRLEREAAELRTLLEQLRAMTGVPAGAERVSRPETLPAKVPSAEPVREEPVPERRVVAVPPLAPETTAPRPAARPASGYDWDKLWRALAGPLAGGERAGSAPPGAGLAGAGPGGGPVAAEGAGRGAGSAASSAEVHIGTVWFSRVGVLLLIVGGILGYRYGVTDNVHRVLIGYAAGLALLALGAWGQRRRYRAWALAITGGGSGILYLTTMAATMFLEPPVLPDPAAFGLMVLITGLTTGLSVYHDSAVIGVLGMVGGFATAVPLATGPYDFRLLFTYIAILDAGLLLVAYFKRWTLYNLLLLLATWGIYGLWRKVAVGWTFDLASSAPYAFWFTTLFFVIFAAVSVTTSLGLEPRRRAGAAAGPGVPAADDPERSEAYTPAGSRPGAQTPVPDLLVVVINAFVYFAAGLDLLRPAFSVTGGGLALGLAAFHLLAGLLVRARRREDRALVLGFLGLAVVFLTVSFPVALNGPWITVFWAVEGATLVWLGFGTGMREGRWAGLAVLALPAVRLAVWETFPDAFGGTWPVPAARALTFLIPVAAFYAAALAYARFKTGPDVGRGLVVAANVFSLWYMSLEICLYYRPAWSAVLASSVRLWPGSALPVLRLVVLTLAGAWGLYGLFLSLTDLRFRQRALRTGARLILGAAMLLLLLGWRLPSGPDFDGVFYFGLAAALGSAWLAELVIRSRGLDRGRNGVLSLAGTLVAFGVLASEVTRLLDLWLAPASGHLGALQSLRLLRWAASVKHFAVAASWGAYALLVAAAASKLRSWTAKVASGVYFGLAIVYAAVVCVPNLAAPEAIRAAAFAALVPGTYLAAYIVAHRGLPAEAGAAGGVAGAPPRAGSMAPGRPDLEVGTWRTVTLGAALLTAWWGAAEVYSCVASSSLNYGSGRLFAVVAWLGFYALSVGLVGRWLRSPEARWTATSLQGVAILVLMVATLDPLASWTFKGLAYAFAVLGLYVSNVAFRSPDRAPAEATATRALGLVACAFTVVWIEREFARLDLDFGVSGGWAVYGLLVLVAGFILKHRWTRVFGLGILALTLGKIGFSDMWHLTVRWRILITIGLGVVFVVASLLYQRFARLILGEPGPSGRRVADSPPGGTK